MMLWIERRSRLRNRLPGRNPRKWSVMFGIPRFLMFDNT